MTEENGPGQEGRPSEIQVIGPLEEEYRWCWQQQDILARHSGQVVVFHNRTLLGSGGDHHEALEDVRQRAAQQGQPLPASGLLFIVVPEPLPVDSPPFPILPNQ